PGVGFLVSTDGGVSWHVYDSTNNVSSFTPNLGDTSTLLPISSTARDRAFVGTIVYQLAIDPQLTPNGQMIIYAAVTNPTDATGGTTGGIWHSQDSGQTWTRLLAGNATSVLLNQDSGIVLDPTTGTNVQGNLQIIYAGIEGTGV